MDPLPPPHLTQPQQPYNACSPGAVLVSSYRLFLIRAQTHASLLPFKKVSQGMSRFFCFFFSFHLYLIKSFSVSVSLDMQAGSLFDFSELFLFDQSGASTSYSVSLGRRRFRRLTNVCGSRVPSSCPLGEISLDSPATTSSLPPSFPPSLHGRRWEEVVPYCLCTHCSH